MEEILQDLSPARLALATEENLSSWIPVLGVIGESRLNDPPGVNRSISPIPVALFNSIMDARLEPGSEESTIQQIKSDAEVRKVPVLWWVGPSTRPANLGKLLEKSGFIIDDDGPGMAVELANLNESQSVPDGLVIEAVHDDSISREWCTTMGLGFEAPAERIDIMADHWQQLICKVNPEITQAFIARLHGKPVATSLLQIGAGVAGIYAVATLPAARRKGIGAQVTLYPLLLARAMGYKAGVLQASQMGFSVYRSLGFQECCRISSYVYRPKPS